MQLYYGPIVARKYQLVERFNVVPQLVRVQ